MGGGGGAAMGDHSLSVSRWVPSMFNSFDHFPNAINSCGTSFFLLFSHNYFTPEEEIVERWVEKFQIGVKFVTKEK